MSLRCNPIPIEDESFYMPTPESQRQLQSYMDAAEAANSPEFKGLVLMSLIAYVDDDTLTEAIEDALRTLAGVTGGDS